MPGMIIRGEHIAVSELTIQNFKDEPKFSLQPNDGRKRPKTWIRGIVLHTTRGIPGGKDRRSQDIRPGLGPDSKRDEKVARMWALDTRNAGAHLIVDSDASWVCTCDLQEFAAFHAGNVNNVTIGIEIYQGCNAELYEGQLKSVVVMCDFLTRHFSIQRQFHTPYKRRAIKRGLQRGTDMVGIYGHRDCSNNRGPGDPGDAIFELLEDCGYEAFDFEQNEDKKIWQQRQEQFELLADGIPGPATVATLKDAGYEHGLWISRPGD